MLSNSNVDQIVQAVREPAFRLELDDVVVTPPGSPPVTAPFRFNVFVEDRHFICRWRFKVGEEPPDAIAPLLKQTEHAITSAADWYEVSGRTEKGITVRLTGVRPFPSITHFGSGATHYTTQFDQLHFPAEGSDALDSLQHLERFRALTGKPASSEPANARREGEPIEELLGIIPSVELQILRPGTETRVMHPLLGESVDLQSNCYTGELLGGKFCLEDRKAEMLVHYQRPVSDPNTTPSARAVFDGLLAALGFTHGCHPWPFYLEHRVDMRVEERWVRPYSERPTRVPLPIERGRLASDDGDRLFRAAAEFFSKPGTEAATFRRGLWLMRDAIRPDMAFEIRLITLCSVFEGLMHSLTAAVLTDAERAELVKQRMKRWELVVTRLQLPWDGAFKAAAKSWDDQRHPLSHGFQVSRHDSNGEVFPAYSRISAAIHILMAKRMGFVGDLDASPMESRAVVSIGR